MEQEFYHYDDRKEFGKTASRCSIALILYVALQYGMVFSFAFAATIAEKVSGGSVDFRFLLNGNNAEIILSVVTAILSFFIVFTGVFHKSFFASLKGRTAFDEAHLVTVGKGLCAMLLSAVIGGLFYACFSFVLGLFGHSYDAEAVLGKEYTGIGNAVYIIYGCVIAPVLEELIFRGYIIGSLKKYSTEAAIFISAAMFALMHGVYAQMPITFLAGLVLGCVAIYRGSVVTTILMHALYNSAIMLYEKQAEGGAFLGIASLVMFAACVCGGINIFTAIKNMIWADGKESGKYCGIFFTRIATLLFAAAHIAIGASLIK